MPHAYKIFDRRRVKLHRDRADIERHGFLLREVEKRLQERLQDFSREFSQGLSVGLPGILPSMQAAMFTEEELLPVALESFDLLVAGGLHWINDLPGALIQIHHALKDGGLFIGLLPGGATLKELRQSFEKAELAMSSGISPRISPFIDVQGGGSLLARAGFSEPVIDSEMLTVSYAHPLKLMHDLRGMGESNALIASKKTFTPCSLLMSVVDVYLRDYSDAEGRIPATFELVTLTGWKSAQRRA